MRFRKFIESVASLHDLKFDNEVLKWLKDFDSQNSNTNLYFFINGNRIGLFFSGEHLKPNHININFQKKEIWPPQNYEYDPYEVEILEKLNSLGFGHYKVGNTTLAETAKKIRLITGKYETWAHPKYDFKSSMKNFGVKIIKEIWEADLYHVTLQKYLSRIKKEGLKPSMTANYIFDKFGSDGGITFDKIPQLGWSTGLNAERQAAVYMYVNKKANADNLAHHLANRERQPSIILKIDGHAIKDYSKLVIDEDALRSEYDAIVEKRLKTRLPHFLYSAINGTNSIGYKGIIPPSAIKIIDRIEPQDIEEEDY